MLVDELHGDAALADGAGDEIDGAGAHIANDKDPGHAALQQERVAVNVPALGPFAAVEQLRPGEDEALSVELHGALEPLGAGPGAG